MSTIIRDSHKKDYTIISNKVFKDTRLSDKAFRVIMILLSHKDGWKFYQKDIQKKVTGCKESIRLALVELEKFGYIKRVQSKDANGKFTPVVFTVIEVPNHEEKPIFSSKKPKIKKILPQPILPVPVKSPLINTNHITSTKNTTTRPPPIREPDKKEVVVSSIQKKDVVFSCLNQLNIPMSLKISISKKYSEENAILAVRRCLNWKDRSNDSVGILTTLKQSNAWNDRISNDDAILDNQAYLEKIQHMSGFHCKSKGMTLFVGAKYIEFAGTGNQRSTIFEAKDRGMKEKIKEYLKGINAKPSSFLL